LKKTKESGVYSRGNTYTVVLDIGRDPSTGRRKQHTKGGFKTQKEAKVYKNSVLSDVSNDTYVNEKNTTFQDFAEQWLKTYEKQVKTSTVRVRKHELGRLYQYFAKIPLKNITKAKYQKALLEMSEDLSHSTLSGVHITAGMVFKKAIEWDIIKKNPSEFAKIPKKIESVEEVENKDEKIKFLEKGELAIFLRSANEVGLEHDPLMFTLLAYSGMRVGEMLALKWKDINFKENTISITKTLYNPSNSLTEYQLLTPKTKASKRTIKMDPKVMDMLKKHKAYQNEQILANKSKYNDEGFIITRKYGYPEIPKTVLNRMNRLLKAAGIKKNLTPHSLRHTHTSLLIEAGVAKDGIGIKEIQQRLGHGDVNTTMNIYAHMTKNMEEKASQKFSELMKDLL
jgi:integrase